MESLGILGFIFGMGALGLVVTLRKEVEELKKELKESGVLKEKNESLNK